MERDGVRDKQFVKSSLEDRQRAHQLGWQTKLIDFKIPQSPTQMTYEAVLDSMAGFVRSSNACAHYQAVAAAKGVEFRFGQETGAVASLVKEKGTLQPEMEKVTGLKTRDGTVHSVDVVVIAGKCLFCSLLHSLTDFCISTAGSFSTQILPELGYHLESSAGSLATFQIDRNDTELWDKYSPERFPVITWKRAPRDQSGKDTGNIYVLPRTPEGLVKIGFRGIKVGLRT
jgi:sarcosine oxidase/L-pipecolate oxidase